MARWIIFLIAGLMLTCADRTFDNPNDNKVSKDSWAPQNFQLEVTGNNSIRLTWTQAETRIDGFVLTKKIGNNIDKINLENNQFSFEDTLANPDFRTSEKVEYFIEAKAGALLSNKKNLDFNLPSEPTLNPELSYGNVTDIDGNIYRTIEIHNQEWMAENLKVKHYRNGDEIENNWYNFQVGAYSSVENDEKNNMHYGLHYNWYAVNDSRGICPSGWAVPSYKDFSELNIYLDFDGSKMKSPAVYWKKLFPNGTINYKNETGFSALPAGFRDQDGKFYNVGFSGSWWSSSETDLNGSESFIRELTDPYIGNQFSSNVSNKTWGFSVRCIKANLPTVTTNLITDISCYSIKTGGIINNEGGSLVMARGVCWNTTGNPTILDNKTSDGSGFGSFLSNPDILKFSTKYFIRAYGTNAAGTQYGNQLEVTTKSNLNSDINYGTVKDIEGNSYSTVMIGSQTWMAENLRVGHYNNGDEIPYAQGASYWSYLAGNTGIFGYFAWDSVYNSIFGKRYNGYAVTDPRGICPSGWHLPSDTEWTLLTDYLGGELTAAIKIKTDNGWEFGNGTNESGFSALPFGYTDGDGGLVGGAIGLSADFWSSTSSGTSYSWVREIGSILDRTSYSNRNGLSVRCVKD